MDVWKRKKKCMEFFTFLSGSQERKLHNNLIYDNKMIKVNQIQCYEGNRVEII